MKKRKLILCCFLSLIVYLIVASTIIYIFQNKFKKIEIFYILCLPGVALILLPFSICLVRKWLRKKEICFDEETPNESFTIEIPYQTRLNLNNYNQPECCVCFENVQSTRLGCGHTSLCHTCAHKIKKEFKLCPICYVPITKIQEEIFTQNREYLSSNSSKNISSSSDKSEPELNSVSSVKLSIEDVDTLKR